MREALRDLEGRLTYALSVMAGNNAATESMWCGRVISQVPHLALAISAMVLLAQHKYGALPT